MNPSSGSPESVAEAVEPFSCLPSAESGGFRGTLHATWSSSSSDGSVELPLDLDWSSSEARSDRTGLWDGSV